MSIFPNGGLFKQGAFQIDPNSTPEMLKAKRDRLAAMMPRYGRARYIGEGIGQLATGIGTGIQSRKMDRFEGERRKEATDALSGILGGPMSILGPRDTLSTSGPHGTPFNPASDQFPVGTNEPATYDSVTSGGEEYHMGRADPSMPEDIKNGIFAGESGGDYNALFGYANRPGGEFQNVQLTDMTVDQALEFSNPSGPYGQSVKSQIGRVATPMGAYQVVGTTLREAKRGLGLTGNERMTPELQDRIGGYILSTQGTGAWEGYKGPQSGPSRITSTQGGPATSGADMAALTQAAANPWLTPQQRQVVNGMIGQQRQREQAVYAQQLSQQDPLYQAKLAQAQFDLDQDQQGLGDAAKVQSSVVLDDGSTVMVMSNGNRRVLSPTGEIVTGQDAADAIRAARDYEVANQREIYAGRREGTLGADIDMGGTAEAAKDVAKATVAAGVSAWEDYGKLQSSIGNISEAITAIDNGAESGIVMKMLPNVTEASASLENAMNRMGLDVVGSVTFGALSEGELRLAMNTAVPRDLSPPELRSWLVKKQAAQQKAANMLADAAQYMTKPGNTINGWIAKNRKGKQVTNTPDARDGSTDYTSDTPIPGLSEDDAELWRFATPEERRAMWGQ